MLEWDDLRYLLAVGRTGTLSAAARQLGVNHSTVFRRVGLIEERLGVRLFERRRDGYTPTPACEEAVALAEKVEGEVNNLERHLAGRDTRPSGMVRVTTTDTLLFGPLAPVFKAARCAYPEISLEVIVDNRFLSLSKRDADIAIRPSLTPPENLIGRRICGIATAIYGAKSYLDRAPATDTIDEHDWIAPDDSLAQLASARWLRTNVKPEQEVFRTNTLYGMLTAARAGLGLAPLPCFIGDSAADLRRVRPPLDQLTSELWLLTHRDLRHVARIRAILDFADRELRKMAALFEGRTP